MVSGNYLLFALAGFLLTSPFPLHSNNERGLLVVDAYATESVPQQGRGTTSSRRHHNIHDNNIERPLLPPFPNGPCGGTVVTVQRKDLFPGQNNDNSILPTPLNLNNPFFSSTSLDSIKSAVLQPRDVKVWLPKEYHLEEYRHRHFPLLYCHDGQNGENLLQMLT